MRAIVTIGFKEGVLDPEAAAIGRALEGLGFAEVKGVRRRKVIELELAGADSAAARARVEAMCDQLLANPVIERWTVEIVDGP
ncbi:MAG: phosphoribosylformylglycinamidine synthase subunit PurS [Geminicoccaceae bacterium]